ncbi:MAG: hypothetical protein NW220_07470 [Leptolyngbyaceae cyanobacterium bins.349]|nr:hypothetical protein [Leptolyngbyaceae cyanobacterium bins.349]
MNGDQRSCLVMNAGTTEEEMEGLAIAWMSRILPQLRHSEISDRVGLFELISE